MTGSGIQYLAQGKTQITPPTSPPPPSEALVSSNPPISISLQETSATFSTFRAPRTLSRNRKPARDEHRSWTSSPARPASGNARLALRLVLPHRARTSQSEPPSSQQRYKHLFHVPQPTANCGPQWRETANKARRPVLLLENPPLPGHDHRQHPTFPSHLHGNRRTRRPTTQSHRLGGNHMEHGVVHAKLDTTDGLGRRSLAVGTGLV